MRRLLATGSIAAAATVLAACGPGTHTGPVVENGDAARGAKRIVHYGCGACHTIGGIEGANADVGPDLRDFDEGRTIAGKLANTPANLIRWIMHPQRIVPGNDMPEMGVTRDDARDIAAYLYTQ